MEIIFLGIIQGLTEFLPISSSGHLYLMKNYLGMSGNLLPFFVFLHFVTLLAICIFLHKEIIEASKDKKLLIHIGIITGLTAAIGIVIDIFVKNLFDSRYFVSFFLLLNAGILLTTRNMSEKRGRNAFKLKDALILGVLQGFAVLPGISRSGITIAGLLKRGFKAKEAFALSFLMAIPIISAVSLLKIKEFLNSGFPVADMVKGGIAAFLFGILALFIVRKMLISKNFDKFGYYCLIIAFLSLILNR